MDCRTDWYQTQTHIILSVFAKNKLETKVNFEKQSLSIDIKMKNNERYQKTIPLFHVSAHCWLQRERDIIVSDDGWL